MQHRRGFTLLEVGAAGAILLMLCSVCLQFFRASSMQRRALRERRTAVREAENAMERITSLSFEEITPENLRNFTPPEPLHQALPGSRLDIEVTEPGGKPRAKQITLVVRWPRGPELPERTVRLVAFCYRHGGRESGKGP